MKRFFSYERRNLLCSHSNGDIFTCENNMLFSRVKTSCFRAKAHLIFHWCLYDNSSLDGDLLAYDCFLFRGGDAGP